MSYLNVTCSFSILNAINNIAASQDSYLELSTLSEANVNIVRLISEGLKP